MGDEIIIRSSGIEYIYKVTSVDISAPKGTEIYLGSDKPILTLSTCWPVGNPLDRTVIQAELVGKSIALN